MVASTSTRWLVETMSDTAHPKDHSRLMDAIYARQRHIYDLTRKYYLLGRDHLIDVLAVPDGGTVLEVACGTGRNLALTARQYPKARLFGFDISTEMLKSAQSTINRAKLSDRVQLAEGNATQFDPAEAFGVPHFDRVFISYSVSMIPAWQTAIAHALDLTSPDGGQLHIVDFGQQARLPGWFRTGLHGWLAKFHVEPRAELNDVMSGLANAQGATLHFRSLYRDYAHYGRIAFPAGD